MLVNTELSGARCIHLMYDANANKLYVRTNDNTGWLGGYAPGTANVIENSYVKLYCAETYKTVVDKTLTVYWRLVAKETMAGKTCSAWMRVTDRSELYTSWDLMSSSYRINTSPYIGALTPQTGQLSTSLPATLAARYSDPDGYADLAECRLLINTALYGGNCIHLMYDHARDLLYLRNDANTGWLGGFAPGSANTIQNSFGILYCQQTTVTGSGAELKMNWRVQPKPAFAGVGKKAWLRANDTFGGLADWVQKGSYEITAP